MANATSPVGSPNLPVVLNIDERLPVELLFLQSSWRDLQAGYSGGASGVGTGGKKVSRIVVYQGGPVKFAAAGTIPPLPASGVYDYTTDFSGITGSIVYDETFSAEGSGPLLLSDRAGTSRIVSGGGNLVVVALVPIAVGGYYPNAQWVGTISCQYRAIKPEGLETYFGYKYPVDTKGY